MGNVLVVGGGIGGFAAALAAHRSGWHARVFEQAAAFGEAGAGIQLGPNATRILRDWGLLQGDLLAAASRPRRLRVRDAVDGRELAALPLGDAIEARYGAPYLTIHRADLHGALLAAARAAGVALHAGTRIASLAELASAVQVRTADGLNPEGDALVAADGLWSALRAQVAGAAPPERTGHLAYRGLVTQADLPPALRSDAEVTVWLAPRMHLVTYPVRGGDALNAVCVVEGALAGDPRDWDHAGVPADLEAALGPVCATVHDQVRAIGAWRRWMLHDRPPVPGADAMARGRIALLGDAAHPMRPYLAQGAGMAIEDAAALQRAFALVSDGIADVPLALRRYALERWPRAARVQARSRRNGVVFHAQGPLRLARNFALRTLGARLLDQPWLYRA